MPPGAWRSCFLTTEQRERPRRCRGKVTCLCLRWECSSVASAYFMFSWIHVWKFDYIVSKLYTMSKLGRLSAGNLFPTNAWFKRPFTSDHVNYKPRWPWEMCPPGNAGACGRKCICSLLTLGFSWVNCCFPPGSVDSLREQKFSTGRKQDDLILIVFSFLELHVDSRTSENSMF